MRFLSVRLKNFLSYQNTKLSLNKRGVVLVLGENRDSSNSDSNGAGKSAIAEAVYWCVTGKTFRPIQADKVVNNHSDGKTCEVELVAKTGGQKYHIIRRRGGSKPSLEIKTADGNVYTKDEAKAVLDTIVPISNDMFANFVCVGKNNRIKLFHEMTDGEKKAVFERMYPSFGTLNRVHEAVTKKLAELTKRTYELDSFIRAKEEMVEDAEDTLRRREVKLKELTEATSPSVLKKKADTIADNKKKLEKYDALIQKYTMDRDQSYAKLEDMKEPKELAQYVEELRYASAKRSDADSAVRSLVSALSKSVCPTCRRPMDGVDEKALRKQLAKAEEEQKVQTEAYEQLNKKRNAIQEAHTQKWAAVKREAANAQAQLTQSLMDKSQLEKTIYRLEGELSQVKTAIQDAKNDAQTARSALEMKKAALTTARDEKTAHNVVQREHELLAKIVSDSGLKSYLMDDVLASVEKHANEMSQYLSDGELKISVSGDGEGGFYAKQGTIVITATNTTGADIYGGNSSGEKTRVDLCVLFGLIKTVVEMHGFNINFLFLDEILDSLDDSGVQSAVELLSEEILNLKDTIFVASHNSSLKDKFTSSLVVRKHHGTSTIIED